MVDLMISLSKCLRIAKGNIHNILLGCLQNKIRAMLDTPPSPLQIQRKTHESGLYRSRSHPCYLVYVSEVSDTEMKTGPSMYCCICLPCTFVAYRDAATHATGFYSSYWKQYQWSSLTKYVEFSCGFHTMEKISKSRSAC